MPTATEAGGLVLLFAPALYLFSQIPSEEAKSAIVYALGTAVLAFAVTLVTIPAVAEYFSRKGLKGRDMGRRGTPDEQKEM
jgi:hypothetical protein